MDRREICRGATWWLKHEILNSKHETIVKHEILNSKHETNLKFKMPKFQTLRFMSLEFVSDFVLRASNFTRLPGCRRSIEDSLQYPTGGVGVAVVQVALAHHPVRAARDE